MSLLLTQGNALTIPLADESVHCVVTSPPYWGLRKYAGEMAQIWGGDPECAHEWGSIDIKDEGYTTRKRWQHGSTREDNPDGWETTNERHGDTCIHCGAWYGELGLEPTPEQYVANMVAVFREVRRVLRSDGTVWLNLGDSYNNTAGWHRNEGTSWHRDGRVGGSATKQAIDHPTLKVKDLCGIPWRVAFALQADGWWLRSDIIWSKPNPMPESVTDRPTKAHEYLFLLTKSARYYYDADAIREPSVYPNDDRKARAKPKHHKRYPTQELAGVRSGSSTYPMRNKRTVWHIATAPYSGAHFATYPPALVEPCIKAGTSERGACPECGNPWERVTETNYTKHRPSGGKKSRIERGNKIHDDGYGNWGTFGTNLRKQTTTLGWQSICEHDHEPQPATVFDPFAGSGTTLQVARQLSRNGIGLDLSLEYLHLARQRLSLDALDAWGKGRKDGKAVTDLPMFEEL